jgi:type II secretory pathway pseudopilin PulG
MLKIIKIIQKKSGQSIIELLVAIGLASLLIPAILTGIVAGRGGRAQEGQRIQAVAVLKSAQEAVRSIAKTSWSGISNNGTYYPAISGGNWTLASGSQTTNGLTTSVVISDTYRDSSGAIVSVGGTRDPSTKKVIITVSWSSPFSSFVTSTNYFTRFKNNAYTDTLLGDFNGGTKNGTAISQTVGSGIANDAQVQLGAGGGVSGGDWCQPQDNVLKTFDLPGQGVAQSISATSSATQNYAYTTTGNNASGDSVDELTISFANPPVVANPHLNNEAKAYGIFVDPGAQYVYFNENNPPNHTVRIANGSDLSVVGYFDQNNKTGTTIFTSGNTGYTVSGSTLYSFDVSSKTGSRSLLGSVALAGNGNRVFVVGSRAYVTTSSTTSQLQIINVSNPASMSVVKSLNTGNNLAGVDVYVDQTQTYAYVVTSYASGQNDFFIVDLNNTNNIYGYSTNGMSPKGIIAVPRNRAILVGSGGTLYQVFDTTTPSAASYCGGMSPSGVTTINSVAAITQPNGQVFSYILTDNSSAEFQIVLGGPGSGQFASSGTFLSSPFKATSSSFFNNFTASINKPSQTTISLQVAVAAAVNNSCVNANYSYVGPDGTTSTFFTPVSASISGQIPFTGSGSYVNPGECFRYQGYFTSNDSTLTPLLYDMRFNYSP